MDQRTTILRHAAKVFLERGFIGTILKDIEEGLNAAQAIELHKFHNLSHLAQQVVVLAFSGHPFVTQENRPGEEETGVRRLVTMIRAVAKAMSSDELVIAALRLLDQREHIEEDLPQPLVAWIGLISMLVAEAQEAGEVRDDLDPAEAAWMLVAMFHGVKDTCYRANTLEAIPARVEAWLPIALGYLGADHDTFLGEK